MNKADQELQNAIDETAELFVSKIHARLKPGHDVEFEYWKACFDAAREYPDAEYLQTKAANALTELMPCLK